MSYKALSDSSYDFLKILDFWFSSEAQSLWFKKDNDFDEAIRQLFGKAYQEAVEKLKDGRIGVYSTGKEALALVIVLDQFSRNMFRDSPQAFAADGTALKISKTAVHKGLDDALPSSTHRNFLYMPFMHSENLEDQEEGIYLFSRIAGNEQTVDYAKQHRDIIARFGRFPHRNKILGRPSTPAEIEFLKEFEGF